VTASTHDVGLAPQTTVDAESRAVARHLLDPHYQPPGSAELEQGTISALSADVLPDSQDQWVQIEADSWRQIRLRALDALADRLITAQRFDAAAGAALPRSPPNRCAGPRRLVTPAPRHAGFTSTLRWTRAEPILENR
jgi:hypothetical protein